MTVLSNGWEFRPKVETEAQRRAFEGDPRRIWERKHRLLVNEIYRMVFGDVAIDRADELRFDAMLVKTMDIMGVDFFLCFPNRMLLAGQEKFLTPEYARFRTVTISEHSWNHCMAQVYFCGYVTADDNGFDPWVLLNWPKVTLATASGDIIWRLTPSHGNYPSFWHTPLDDLPRSCLIAGKLS